MNSTGKGRTGRAHYDYAAAPAEVFLNGSRACAAVGVCADHDMPLALCRAAVPAPASGGGLCDSGCAQCRDEVEAQAARLVRTRRAGGALSRSGRRPGCSTHARRSARRRGRDGGRSEWRPPA